VQRPRPASHAHFRHRHISVTDTCGLSIDEFGEMSVCESATQRLSDVSITGSSSRSTSLVTRRSQADPITSPWQLFNINKCPRRRAHCSDQRLIRVTYLLCPRVCVRACGSRERSVFAARYTPMSCYGCFRLRKRSAGQLSRNENIFIYA